MTQDLFNFLTLVLSMHSMYIGQPYQHMYQNRQSGRGPMLRDHRSDRGGSMI